MKIEEIDVDAQIGEVGRILREAEKRRGVLIHILQMIQEDMGYLPEEVLRNLSRKIALPLSEIYSVASFYKQFHFKPRGKKIVKVCMGTACYVRGGKQILNTLQDHFQVKAGETTEDLSMTLETVGCIGCCGLAPVATVNDKVTGEIGASKLQGLVKEVGEV